MPTTSLLLSALGLLLSGAAVIRSAGALETYIVQMREDDSQASRLLRRSVIDASLDSVAVDRAAVLYTYDNALSGYAAALTGDQVAALRGQPGVLSVRRDGVNYLHTSRSSAFLGLEDAALLGQGYGGGYGGGTEGLNGTSNNSNNNNNPESDLVVGVLDTGIWPENPSFHDDGMPPVPVWWKGECEEGERFPATSCNRKLVGARAFSKGYVANVTNGTGVWNWTAAGETPSALDDSGHGTHTASTAAGAAVPGVSLFGLAAGTARGMAPGARIAAYKVCWARGCMDSDIIAAMDSAIEDGVDLMSLSLGPSEPSFNELEGIVVGSYAAARKDIFVSVSAGNQGPGLGTVTALAPWILSVGASTLDRDFPAYVTLGNGKTYTGASLYVNGSVPGVAPLADGEAIALVLGSQADKGNATTASLCLDGGLDPAKVAGKMVVCARGGNNSRVAKGGVVKAAGGRGMLLVNPPANGNEIVADSHVLPALHLSAADGAEVEAYARSGNGTAVLRFEGTRLGVPAPLMAGFSSRGPNVPVPQLLKPDITGPGVSILAAWTGGVGPTGGANDTRRVAFNIISGTSMSCPHLSGIALFVMARRPEWSPAAVRSALMTTAYTTTKGGDQSPMLDAANLQPATPLSYGNGHVDPVAALDPGLVYDIHPDDYFDFLCAINATSAFIGGITRGNRTCATDGGYSAYDLNYPSFSVLYGGGAPTPGAANGTYTATLRRTVTNVGGPGTYTAEVSLRDPGLVKVSVEPATLSFAAAGEKQGYAVTVTMCTPPSRNATSSGRLVWSDGTHVVGSALSFVWGVGS
ncbi:PA domain-containing protein [Colletotrichum higginsianum]|nr:PA domain-containing protein [Colletotrichum higginsianum]